MDAVFAAITPVGAAPAWRWPLPPSFHTRPGGGFGVDGLEGARGMEFHVAYRVVERIQQRRNRLLRSFAKSR